MELIWPSVDRLEGLRRALLRGWSPDSQRGEDAARAELALIDADRAAYVAAQVDRAASGPPIVLPNGATAPRLPGFRRWMWDGDFCGIIGLRWQPGTTELPPYCLGHVGYSVVPWKQRRGHATAALGTMLVDARDEGLPSITVTTTVRNLASRRVIEANGGVLVEAFDQPVEHGGAASLRFRIDLAPSRRP